MMPQPDQHVRCIFKNGTLIEGIVKEWAPSGAQLQSLNDESILIIPHPDTDIMLIKVLPNKNTETKNLTSIQQEIRENLKVVEKAPVSEAEQEFQSKSIEELKQLVIEQDKQIIANKIKEHFSTGIKKTNYSSQASLLRKNKHG